MDFPYPTITPPWINTFTRWASGLGGSMLGTSNPASYSWPTASLAFFIPIFVPWPYPVRRAFWCNGATAAGNSDIGIYSMGGGKIWTAGSTANSGASAIQYVTVSPDLLLPPGPYYLGYVNDGTTNRAFGTTGLTTINGRAIGMYQQASALPLPTSLTLAAFASTGWPLIGLTRVASGF